VAVVTRGNGGIGRGTAMGLAEAGAAVAMLVIPAFALERTL
jgi:NAD(P)-dependent dehydrogenase (short-subunit alcohol dehydrogenase family)